MTLWTDQDTKQANNIDNPIDTKKGYCPGCNKQKKLRFYLTYYWCKTCDFREAI